MALQTFTPPIPFNFPIDGTTAYANMVNNGTNENAGIVGYLVLEGGSGTKTLSAAGGGHIYIAMTTAIFSTASTEYRVGLEDLNASGLGDGTQDVYGAKVAGTDTISSNAIIDFPMTSGTKTVSHGDRIAITGRMPVRAGADSLNVGSFFRAAWFNINQPYGVANGSDADERLWAMIKFDDGTYGWIQDTPVYPFATNTGSVSSTSSPDEYCAIFTINATISINAIGFPIDDNNNAGDAYELILYSDPLGTPTAIHTVAITAATMARDINTTRMSLMPIPSTTLQPGTYGIACRVTGGTVVFDYFSTQSGFEFMKKLIPFITDCKLGGRTDQTGAFTEVATHAIPVFTFRVNGFEDGVGTGGAGGSFTFIG